VLTAEGRRFWEEKGNLAVMSALEEAESFIAYTSLVAVADADNPYSLMPYLGEAI
jgi:hypothetical protein